MNGLSEISELEPAQRDLLRVVRAAVSGSVPDQPPSDWAVVLELAHFHQLDHFLYLTVRNWPPSSRPEASLLARWRNAFMGAAAQYTRAAAQTAELLAALHAAGVRVVPLKGVWLAESIYEDGTCRPMCDMDLLVRPADLKTACTVFERLGYSTTDFYSSIERDKHIRYNHPDGILPVELHWRLWHEGKIRSLGEPDLEMIWSDLQEQKLHGAPVLVFPPDRQLVYLAQHIQHHSLVIPLRAYLDLILLCRRYAPQFEPSRLEAEARAWCVPFGARFVLQVAADIFGEVPESVRFFLPGEGVHESERQAAMCAALQLNGESCKITVSMESCQQASLFRRLGLGLSRVFLPPDMIRSGYSKAVHRFGLPGGYLARLADLVRRRGQTWKTVARDDPAMDADLKNFRTRQMLSNWIHAQDAQ